MKIARRSRILGLSLALVAVGASAVQAQGKVELGTSLVSATVILDNNGGDNMTVIGVPSGGVFSLFNPSVYVSVFVHPHIAIEPQIGLVFLTSGGESEHVLNAAVQFDYFIKNTSVRSPYVFVTGGLLDSGDDYTPKTVGGGAGFRIPVGDRLVFRVDGRYTHYTSDFGDGVNTVAFTVSIGGLFGR